MADDENTGRWITDGGRLLYIPPLDSEDDDKDDEKAYSVKIKHNAQDDSASGIDDLPDGAPESAIVQVMLDWLGSQIKTRMDAINMFLLAERERKRGQTDEDAKHIRRRHETAEISPIQEDIAFHEGAAQWFDDARRALHNEYLHTGSRAMTEWYMWVLSERASFHTGDPADIHSAARTSGMAEACEETMRRTERLVEPETDD